MHYKEILFLQQPENVTSDKLK